LLGLPSAEGVLVRGVVPGGPAEKAGVRPGDVITRFADTQVKTVEEFLGTLRRTKPGDRVKIQIRRGDRTEDRTITVGALIR